MARAHSKPVTFFLDLDACEEWTYRDRLLALAYEEHLGGLHSCGYPTSLSLSPHSDGYFKVSRVLCNACAASDNASRHAGDDPIPGERTFVANTMDPGEAVRAWDGHPLGAD